MHLSGEEGMSVLRLANEAVRRSISLICIGLLATGSFAQNAPSQAPPANVATPTSAPEPVPPMPQAPAPQHNAEAHPYSINDYTRGQSSFPRIWQPYVGRHVSPSNITNSAMIDSVIRDGKVYLTLNDA